MSTKHLLPPPGERVLPLPNAPWVVQEVGSAVFVILTARHLIRWQQEGRPGLECLLYISAFSLWWQEFYADWGCYLYYNPDFALLPWGSTLFTTPNKPWYVVTAYGWFYSAAFPRILKLSAAMRRRWPNMSNAVVLTITALIPFYFWNLLSADLLAFYTNWYQYLYTIGPAIQTSKGAMPYVYPAFPFVTFAPFTVWSIENRDSAGRTWFERWCGAEPHPKHFSGQIKQLFAWCVGLNIMYLCSLTVPLITVRLLFLPHSTVIP